MDRSARRARAGWVLVGWLLAGLVAQGAARAQAPGAQPAPQPPAVDAGAAAAAERWESAIAEFEAQDRRAPLPRGGIVFVGSSSIRRWDLGVSFPKLGAINRGFGGSQLADSVRYAERAVIPYQPRTVVLYAGDNDIAAGVSPEQVAADFRAFTAKIHAALPRTKIVFISIKPSVARFAQVAAMRAANAQIRESCSKDARLAYVDIDPLMLGADGVPRPELFVEDGLHLSAQGYAIWAAALAPQLE